MKISLNGIAVFVLLCFALLPVTLARCDVPVADFSSKPFDYGYEGWKDLTTVQTSTGKGVELKGEAKGGAGIVFQEPIDISTAKQLEVKIKRGSGNTADTILVKIGSSDGKFSPFWTISTATISDTNFTTITLDLAPAQKGGVKLESIKHLQIQGNFTPDTQVDVEIGSVTATGTATPPAPPAISPPPAAK